MQLPVGFKVVGPTFHGSSVDGKSQYLTIRTGATSETTPSVFR